jgi:hypothetical protein
MVKAPLLCEEYNFKYESLQMASTREKQIIASQTIRPIYRRVGALGVMIPVADSFSICDEQLKSLRGHTRMIRRPTKIGVTPATS